MDQANFQNSLSRAQELMLSEEFNAKVESKAGKVRKNKGGGSSEFSMLEAQAFGYTPSQGNETYEKIQTVQTKRNMNDCKMPKAIMESIQNLPLMSGDDSMVETMPIMEEITRNVKQYAPTPTPIKEERSVGSNVDYALIKTIVEECFRQHEKKQLNEGVVRGFKIGSGNKIQFVDSKGNLYEGVLTLKKRASK